MGACNHVPREQTKERFCQLCGQPLVYFTPAIGQLTEPIMEYAVVQMVDGTSRFVDVLNREARDGWRVVASIGMDVIIERPRKTE
jgi:hypothetical protein